MTDEFNVNNGEETQLETDVDMDEPYVFEPGKVYMDMVYCIDLTKSMDPLIKMVKKQVMTLYEDLQTWMIMGFNRKIQQMRIKIIGFRDFYCDGKYALEQSDFFYLPDENEKFKAYIDGLEAKGGGDIPENAFEALALALQSDWCTTDDNSVRRIHAITLVTDAPAHPLEKGINCTNPIYPKNMPRSYVEFVDRWCGQYEPLDGDDVVCMNQYAKYLFAVVPEESEPWTDLSDDLDNYFIYFVNRHNCATDIDARNLNMYICRSFFDDMV